MGSLTKIDVAAANLSAAVRLFFDDEPLPPVFTLAAAAREIIATLGEKLNRNTVHRRLAARRGVSIPQLVANLTKIANFTKHADRDPAATIDIEENDVRILLALACHDFGRIARGKPVEAQVFEAWSYAIAFDRVSEAPLRHQAMIKRTIKKFYGVRTATPVRQKEIGKRVLLEALQDPDLRMDFERFVRLPEIEAPPA